jgi:hypothetical protein
MSVVMLYHSGRQLDSSDFVNPLSYFTNLIHNWTVPSTWANSSAAALAIQGDPTSPLLAICLLRGHAK